MKKLNKIIGEAVLISPLFALSFLFDLWSECLLMIVALFFYKSLYPQQYHADRNIVCILLSYLTISIGIIIAYVFRKQYILIILLYNIIAFISARVGYMQIQSKKYDIIAEPYKELVIFYKKSIEKKPFNTNSCTETELIDRCKELNFSEYNTKLAVLFFIKKLKHRDIADMLSIEEDSVTKSKYRMKKLLNKVDN